jgi:hypothetical protein
MMKNNKLLICCLMLLTGVFTSCSTTPKAPDRNGLVSLMEQYLNALAKHDPTAAPIAEDAKFVENTVVTPIGKGLWETATGGPTQFRIFVPDTVAGQIAFMGVIEENNKPVILGARLKIVEGKITEIDHLVIHSDGKPLNPNMSQVRQSFLETVAPGERVPREEMLNIADSYYTALTGENGKLAPFADECQRRENGSITANDHTQTPEEAAKDDFSVFRKMNCTDQLNTGVMSYITDINRRRFIAVDEIKGLVFVYSIFVHNGEPKVMKIIGVPGITERANNYGPFDLPAAHVFKIRAGKIYDIEAIGYVAKHGIKNGWE